MRVQLEEEKKRLLVSQERRTSQFGGGGAGGWDSGFLEGDDDVDAGDLGAIRAQVTGRKRRASTPGNRAPRRRAPARPRSSSARRPASRSRAGAGRRRLGDDDDDDDEEEAEMSADGALLQPRAPFEPSSPCPILTAPHARAPPARRLQTATRMRWRASSWTTTTTRMWAQTTTTTCRRSVSTSGDVAQRPRTHAFGALSIWLDPWLTHDWRACLRVRAACLCRRHSRSCYRACSQLTAGRWSCDRASGWLQGVLVRPVRSTAERDSPHSPAVECPDCRRGRDTVGGSWSLARLSTPSRHADMRVAYYPVGTRLSHLGSAGRGARGRRSGAPSPPRKATGPGTASRDCRVGTGPSGRSPDGDRPVTGQV